MHYPIRVLFLCTGNSARSQMAEAFLRSFGGSDFEVHSAGTEPTELHPLTIKVMNESNIDVSKQKSKHLNQFLGQSFDYIITVCDRARDNCPTFPGDHERIHWSYDDPAANTNDEVAQYLLFRRVRNEIADRIRVWVAAQRKKLKEMGIEIQA